MDEPGLVFRVITEAGSHVNIVASFMEHLEDIFAHVKSEIIEFCETFELQILIQIRQNIYDKLLTLFPLVDYDLIERRKVASLAEHIYVLGFSLISKTEHKSLARRLKNKGIRDQSIVMKNQKEENDILELVATCLALKNNVKELNSKISLLTDRILILEDEVCSLKSTVPSSINPPEVLPLTDKNVSQEEVKSADKPTLVVSAEVHHDINGVKQKPLPIFNDDIEVLDSPDKSETAFRHTRKDRKNILKKP